MKSKRTKAVDISQAVKLKVWERDNQCCVLCGAIGNPNAHYISRAQSGLGVEQNIVTLCNSCHFKYDNTVLRKEIKELLKDYLKSKYPDWDERNLVYRK
jgi:5-methylcytosine-specific restriction endonuclease McrA